MTTTLKHVKRTIHNHIKRYGLPIDYHVIDQHDVDPETGNKTTVLAVKHVRKAVVMRTREFRSFVYDLAYISANKDFTTGGYFDPNDRTVLVEASDLGTFVPTVDDFIIFKNLRYQVTEVYAFEVNGMYAFNTKSLRGAEISRIESRHSGVIVTDSVSYELIDKLVRDVTDNIVLTEDVIEVP